MDEYGTKRREAVDATASVGKSRGGDAVCIRLGSSWHKSRICWPNLHVPIFKITDVVSGRIPATGAGRAFYDGWSLTITVWSAAVANVVERTADAAPCVVDVLRPSRAFIANERRQLVFVVVGIHDETKANLLVVAGAFDESCGGTCLAQGWKQHAGQNGDDGDDNSLFICICVFLVYITHCSHENQQQKKRAKK